ncbi:MAG: hypothetical protein Q9225_001504 [Loekoesia sp. 1 TL-2023]
MGLVKADKLTPQRKRQAQRMVVDSSLDIDTIAVDCNWRTVVFLALGLGVSPIDASLHSLGGNKNAINEQSLRPTALHSENGQRLVEIRWHEGGPSLELTEKCSTWSIRRSLAHFLHMVVKGDGRQEVLHFVPTTTRAGQTSTTRICDCKNIVSDPVKFSTLKNIHYALTWTLYFEELVHQTRSEEIPIQQSLLLMQFEVMEDLRQMPVETLHSCAFRVFPSDATLATNVISTLASTWNSPEHQNLLSRLSGNEYQKSFAKPQRVEPRTSPRPLELHSNEPDHDVEKATKLDGLTGFPHFSEKSTFKDDGQVEFDFFPSLITSPTFKTLSSVYNPFIAITTMSNQAGHSNSNFASSGAAMDIDDPSTSEGLLARLIIALSTMRHSMAPKNWVTSIASGKMQYKIGPEAGEDKMKKLLEYEEGTFRIE